MSPLSIISLSNEPSFNLAAEEYLLKHKSEDIQFFYINSPSVIIGKHQNALAEVNLPYIEKRNIPLYRRLSGGGTVYHDEGNINYCFIKNGESGDLVNFKKATQPITEALNQWGVPARSGQRNDLLVHYKKISGNACHVFKNRVMHHGTLLYNSNLAVLTESLKSDALRFRDKAVKSVRSQVVNLMDEINKGWTANEFLNSLERVLRENTNSEIYSFTPEEILAIEKLKTEKYNTWEWNYGYSPSYGFKKRVRIGDAIFTIDMEVVKGRIAEIKILSNHVDKHFSTEIVKATQNIYHEKTHIKDALTKIQPLLHSDINHEELIILFF